MSAQRNQNGATLGLIVVCSLVLVILTVGLFQVCMLMGGSQEVRNAVDAGALNVGKQVCNDVSAKTSAGGGAEGQFTDVQDRSGHIGLLNINRVIGKAFLVNANVQAMTGGYSSGLAASHAADVANAAETICQKLTDRLKDKTVTQPFFDSYLAANSVRMLGLNAKIQSDASGWETACTDRDEESNLRVANSQLPSGVTLAPSDTKSVSEKAGAGTGIFFRGYHGLTANGRTFSMVPFKYDEKPHLISGLSFEQAKLPLSSWSKPVPNAFSARGITSNQKYYANSAVAYVVANPQRQYQLAIPHAFIRIKLQKNDVHYSVNVEPDHDSTYDFVPGQYNPEVVIHPVGTGTLHGNSTLGNEYIPPTLRQAIHALSDHPEVTAVLLQRVREIKSDFTESDLNSLLNSTPLIPGVDEYIIYPTYGTADNTDPTMHCSPTAIAKAAATWLNVSASADGSEQQIASENRPPFTAPNIGTSYLTGTGCKPPGPTLVSETGELKWTPGSGYDQCLGTLHIHRTTSIRYTGVCTLF